MRDLIATTAAELQAEGNALRALARSILRTTDGAEDVVQDAFASQLAQPVAAGNRRGWLARVVQNLARRRLRDQGRRQRHLAQLPTPAPAPAVDAIASEVEAHRDLAAALLTLAPGYQRTIVLRFWHDLPPRAIARRLGIPVATVKSQLHRGLHDLRVRLDRTHGRTRWLPAMVPIARPDLTLAAGAQPPTATLLFSALLLMKTKLLVTVAAVVGLALLLWRPWAAEPTATPTMPPTVAAPTPAGTGGSSAAANAGDAPDGPEAARLAAERTQADDRSHCTLVGRIVLPGGAAAAGGRFRLDSYRHVEPRPTATADDNGEFVLRVQLAGTAFAHLPFEIALADAAGWAVRERELPYSITKQIVAGRLDLGTFELERGCAVHGRVVEANGNPLSSRCRLLAWDPSNRGSWSAMSSGRSVGFAEVGGRIQIDERLAAPPAGVIMLMAIGSTGIGWAELAISKGREQIDPVTIQLLPGGPVDVRVIDSDGRPVAAADVHAVPYLSPIGLSPMWSEDLAGQSPDLPEAAALLQRRTDADGRARFEHLPLRDHPQVRDANLQQPAKGAAILSAEAADYLTAIAVVDPGQGEAAAVTLTLRRRWRVTITGVVKTAANEPVAGVEVTDGHGGSSTTDAQGKYALGERDFARDDVLLHARGDDVPTAYSTVALPTGVTRIEHDIVVERRSPVRGRVVDQHGNAVAGAEIMLGGEDGWFHPSVPTHTGADGVFDFPDALPSDSELRIQPPKPVAAWVTCPNRPVQNRGNEVIVLQRATSQLVGLQVRIVDGRTNSPVSATAVELRHCRGPRFEVLSFPPTERSHGAITASDLAPGDYELRVQAGDEISAEHRFSIAPSPELHTETVVLWPPAAVTGTVDMSKLPSELQARCQGKTVMAVFDAHEERSYAVDERGERLGLTPNTILVQLGSAPRFRLERVTANVRRRLQVLDEDLFGEVWLVAKPGAVTDVTLQVTTRGRVHFRLPAAWPSGTIHCERHDGSEWHSAATWTEPETPETTILAAPTGPLRWRLRWLPDDGSAAIERSGDAVVTAGGVTEVRID